jgi:hypothetical protein
MFEKPKDNSKKQNNISSKISDPYAKFKNMNNTLPMPYTHSINFNIPTTNGSVPLYAQTPIPMNSINHMGQMPFGYPYQPMPFGHPYQPIKKYNIQLSTGDLSTIKHIYEDMLPKNHSNHPDRYATIIERLNIADYYRLIFNKHYSHYEELKDILKEVPESSLSYLLGHIKINYFNSYYKYNNNETSIIKDLTSHPKNFIMFNVCFPITYNNNIITCKDDSIRAQMRIYKLFDINTTDREQIKALNNIAFELLYYNKIKNFIKTNKYPNFVLSYGEIFAPCNIDFDNIDELYLQNIHSLSDNISKQNNCLLILTESVNYNIIQWASKQYDKSENDNNNIYVSEVISTGVRSVEAWKSVIFQLLVAIYILDYNNIGFKNFSLKDNVFIKKIDITPPDIRYWKYIIGGVEYYVPNHGFLVMIDSNFTDNNYIVIDGKERSQITPPVNNTYDYKNEIDRNIIIKNIFENFINLKTSGDVTIPDSLINTFQEIINNVQTVPLKSIINENFNSYLYEKIGYMIQESEWNEYKLLEYDKNFEIGELVLYKKYSNVHIISTYKGSKKLAHNYIHEINTNTTVLNEYDEDNIRLEVVEVTEDLITKFNYKSNKVVIETYKIN